MKSYIRYIYTSILLIHFTLPAAAGTGHRVPKVYVLAYHSFLGRNTVSTDFSIEEFRNHMQNLEGAGFRFVSFRDIVSGNIAGDRNILITVDDGNHSLWDAYRGVMKPRGIRPMVAVYPSIISRKKYALTWRQLSVMAADGCEIAAHGYYHLPLKKKLVKRKDEDVHREIVTSKRVLETRLKRKISVFVYPHGAYCMNVKPLLKKAGYSCAFTIEWGALVCPAGRNGDPYALPRYMVLRNNWKHLYARLRGEPAGKERVVVAKTGPVKLPAVTRKLPPERRSRFAVKRGFTRLHSTKRRLLKSTVGRIGVYKTTTCRKLKKLIGQRKETGTFDHKVPVIPGKGNNKLPKSILGEGYRKLLDKRREQIDFKKDLMI